MSGPCYFFPLRRDEPVQCILRRALDRQGLSRRLDRHVPRSAWVDAVGEELAARATPTVLSGGTLHLLVQDHRWRDQIDAARTLVIDRLNRRLGQRLVRALQFGLAHEGALSALASPPGPPASPTDGAIPANASRLTGEVREVFLLAAAASRRRPRRPPW